MPFGTSGCTHSFAFSTINNESGTVVPLPTSAACAPRRPSHATASLLQSLSQDSRVWRAVTTTVVGLVPQGQGYRVTKGYPSEVRSMVKHFVTLFRSTKALGWGVLCVCRRILSCGGGGGSWRGATHSFASAQWAGTRSLDQDDPDVFRTPKCRRPHNGTFAISATRGSPCA